MTGERVEVGVGRGMVVVVGTLGGDVEGGGRGEEGAKNWGGRAPQHHHTVTLFQMTSLSSPNLNKEEYSSTKLP